MPTAYQQTPLFSDVARWFAYPVRTQPTLNYCRIDTAFGSVRGYINLKPQTYFVACALTCWTNYDDVAPPVKTANSNTILPRSFTPDNFTVQITRDSYNVYSNRPLSQAEVMSSGYRAGKVFPNPVAYSPRSNLNFNFQDTTGLFLLTATSAGSAVPLDIYTFLVGYDVPISNWDKFCRVFPQFATVYGA